MTPTYSTRRPIAQGDMIEPIMPSPPKQKPRVDPPTAALVSWADAIPSVFDAIGPPGDFGYGTKRGMALSDLLFAYRGIKRGESIPTSQVSAMMREIESVTWPKDVKRCLPAFYSALKTLQDREQDLIESEW